MKPMVQHGLTLVTYTYNDARLVNELLEAAAEWTVIPSKVVVVDDHSATPYSPPEQTRHLPFPLQIIRLAKNSGPAMAKKVGLETVSAETEIIFSIDCDIRPDRDWLRQALPHLQEREIGLLGSPTRYPEGTDSASRYLHLLYRSLYQDKKHPDFMGAGVWLLRSEVWRAAGGFGDFTGRTHEDHVFSQRIRAAEYKLFLFQESPVIQVRKLGRRSIASEPAAYLGPSLKKVIERNGFHVAINPYAEQVLARLTTILEHGDLHLVYIELLCHCAMLAALTQAGTKFDGHIRSNASLGKAIQRTLKGCPRMHELLQQDLQKMAFQLEGDEGKETPEFWEPILNIFTPLQTAGVFDWLEREGIADIKREDQTVAFDFHYLGNH